MEILVVDDDKEMRSLLERTLGTWGYEVASVGDGESALGILLEKGFNFVLCDWMMPGMDGPELCTRIRNSSLPGYTYIIMLTAKSDVKEVVAGLESGADDFVVKPFNKEELKVRIKAGERILSLEKDLEGKNRELVTSNEELNKLYTAIAKDLDAAAKGQKSLLPETPLEVFGYSFDSIFLPSRYLAGDMFNFFTLDENHIAFYLLDVMGHGIPAAMLSVTLSRFLAPMPVYSSMLKRNLDRPPYYEIISPQGVVEELNDRFLSGDDEIQYFTIIYGIVERKEGMVRFVQGGHPPPIHMKADGTMELVGTGGYPVGMLPGVTFQEVNCLLAPGERLILYSDGASECAGKEGEPFTSHRLMKHLEKGYGRNLETLLASVEDGLNGWREGDYFDDDVSILAIGRD